jgi:hypothetical protein
MGKLWGAFLKAWTGGGSPGKGHKNAYNDKKAVYHGAARDTTTTQATQTQNMGSTIKKYEITEVCMLV